MSRGHSPKEANQGGPGRSAKHTLLSEEERRQERIHPDSPTNGAQSHVSGGGGERDSHHVAEPRGKGGQKGL